MVHSIRSCRRSRQAKKKHPLALSTIWWPFPELIQACGCDGTRLHWSGWHVNEKRRHIRQNPQTRRHGHLWGTVLGTTQSPSVPPHLQGVIPGSGRSAVYLNLRSIRTEACCGTAPSPPRSNYGRHTRSSQSSWSFLRYHKTTPGCQRISAPKQTYIFNTFSQELSEVSPHCMHLIIVIKKIRDNFPTTWVTL